MVALERKLCQYWCEKARKHICVTDRHDMTLAVKVPLNPNTTNQLITKDIDMYFELEVVHYQKGNPSIKGRLPSKYC